MSKSIALFHRRQILIVGSRNNLDQDLGSFEPLSSHHAVAQHVVSDSLLILRLDVLLHVRFLQLI